jgi:uncharacterized tellurite resistance protein B-like protein
MKLKDILSLFKQGKASAHSHMKNLIEIAAADGHFHDDEYALLKVIANKYGVSESKLAKIRKNPQGVEFEVPADKDERFSQLFDLVHMMIADKLVSREDLRLCHVYAKRFGYSEKQVPELVDSIRQNIENGNSREDTAARLSWML